MLVNGNKPARLGSLSAIAESQWTALNGAYAGVGRQGDAPGAVVGSTVSTLVSDTASYGYAATSGGTDEVALTGYVNPRTQLPAFPLDEPPVPLQPLFRNWPTSPNLPQPTLPSVLTTSTAIYQANPRLGRRTGNRTLRETTQRRGTDTGT
jgi:hypothetical protein